MNSDEKRFGRFGWAHVKGRNAVDWENRFELDVWYVENQSFLLDLRILIATVFAFLSRKGINSEGAATTAEFQGAGNQAGEAGNR